MTEDRTPYPDDAEDDNPIMRAFIDTLTKEERLALLGLGIEPNPDYPTAEPAPSAFNDDPWGNNLKRYPWHI